MIKFANMQQTQWQLQTAKAQLSELVEAALRGEPQRITRRGKDAVMVLSEQAYVALTSSAKSDAPDFVAHLLAIPREKAVSRQALTNLATGASRAPLKLRDIDL
jgi:antitoxin Phd